MMTVQEFARKYKADNPQFSHIDDFELASDLVTTYPELKSKVDIQVSPKKASVPVQQTPKSEPIKETIDPSSNYLVGGAKALGRTGLDLLKMAKGTSDYLINNPITRAVEKNVPLVKKANQAISNAENKLLNTADQKLQATTQKQKVGGYVETAAELALPVLKVAQIRKASKVAGALDMSLDELKQLSAGKFRKIFNMEKGDLETVGGFAKNQAKEMPKKIGELATEFKNILTGDVTKDMRNVKTAKTSLWNRTIKLVEDNNVSVTENEIRKIIGDKINDNVIFDSVTQQGQTLKKTIDPFIKKIKTLDLKGLEEARGALSSSSRDASGKLKQSIDLLHSAVKDLIKEKLPEGERVVYDALKKEHAKLFDIQDILRAKNSPALLSGTSKLKKAAKFTVGALGIGTAGNWIAGKLR